MDRIVMEKDGHTLVAYTPVQRVNLEARGYAEVVERPAPEPEAPSLNVVEDFDDEYDTID